MRNNNIKIRSIRKTDLKETAIIYKESFNKSGFKEHWTNNSALKFIEYWFDRQQDLFFIAIKDNKIVGGIVSSIKPWWGGLTLVDTELFIDPKNQGQGIGKLLLKRHLKEALDKYKVRYAEALTTDKTKFPLSWYKKIGFESSGLIHLEGTVKEILNKLN